MEAAAAAATAAATAAAITAVAPAAVHAFGQFLDVYSTAAKAFLVVSLVRHNST